MKKPDFKKGWDAFLQWKGWKAAADFCVKCWSSTIRWKGWKVLFGLPVLLLLALSIFCVVGLIWVFTHDRMEWVPSYFLYAVSAYCLSAVCVRLPSALREGKQWLAQHPKLTAFLANEDLQFRLELYVEQLINFAYGSFKIASGVILGSAWIGSDGIYNLAQAMIQLFQILRRKNPGSLRQQWRSYRVCGGLILLMHLTLIGIVFQMVNWNRAEDSGEIMIITTAAFAFYKFASAFLGLAKDRKHTHPVDSSVRMLKFSQAIFAIFSLQAGLLHTFGTGEHWEYWLNLVMGCMVCLLTVAMGIYMIRRANREMRQLQENGHGT